MRHYYRGPVFESLSTIEIQGEFDNIHAQNMFIIANKND